MLKTLAATTAAIILLAPAAARAADGELFKAFQEICLTGAPGPADVMSRAKAAGYLTPPPNLAKTFKGGQVSSAVTAWKPFEGGMYVVIAGGIPFPGVPGLDSDACVIVVNPSQADAERQMTTGLGVGAPDRINGQSIYIFQQQADGKLASVSAIPETRMRLIQAGRLRMGIAKVDAAADTATLTLMVPRR